MKQRVITAAVMLIIIVPVILLGKTAMFALCIFVSTLAHYEYVKTVTDSNLAYIDIGFGCAALMCGVLLPKLCVPLFLIGASMVLMTHILFTKTVEGADKLMYRIWGFYIPVCITLGLHFMFGRADGYILFLFSIASCISCDTAAYFFGIHFGKHRLSPEISPKKSVEGSVSGFAAAVLVMAAASFVPSVELSLAELLAGGAIVGIFSQFGDLSASLIKRRFAIKDYSNILPGHGGVLDRIDAILFTLLSTYIYLSTVIK